MVRAWLTVAVLLAGVVAGAGAAGCVGSGEPNCAQYSECGTCVMDSPCGWCFETNLCIVDSATCPGDRAQTPDMCAE